MITKETLSAAPAWTLFRGEAADPGAIFWALFDIEPADYGFVEDPAHDLEALDVVFTEPELDDEYRSEQPAGADNLDAALAYLRRGGTLCKVPDAPGSPYWRLLVVGEPVRTHDFRIEARTPGGPISWHPYSSYAAAQADLARIKKQARTLGVIRGSWQIVPLHEAVTAAAGATTAARALTAWQRKLLAKAFVDYQATNADRFARKITMHLGTRLRPHQPPLSAEEAAAIGARFVAKVDTDDDRAAAVLLFALPFALPETMTDRQTDALLAAIAPSAELSKLPGTNRAIRELGQVVERIRRRSVEPIPAPRARRGRSR